MKRTSLAAPWRVDSSDSREPSFAVHSVGYQLDSHFTLNAVPSCKDPTSNLRMRTPTVLLAQW